MKQTIRIITALFLLMTGSIGVWAGDITCSVTGGGSAEANNLGGCGYLSIELEVTPAAGYTTRKDWITVTNKTTGRQYEIQDCNISGSTYTLYVKKPNEYDLSLQEPTKDNVIVNVHFLGGLKLQSNLANATVTWYDGGNAVPTAIPTSTTPAISVVKETYGAAQDHYVIAHIVPNGGYWTDQKFLDVMEAGRSLTRSSLDLDSDSKLTLLEADKDDSDNPRNDGAGWYYYKIPADNFFNVDYTTSVLDGELVKWFNLSDDDDADGAVVKQDGTKITVPNGEGWTAEITLDAVTFPFDGTEKKPTVTGITLNKGTKQIITLTSGFDKQLLVRGTKLIGKFPVDGSDYLLSAVNYCWFYGTTNAKDVNIDITVPLPVADETAERGTATNPWLVTSIADMALFGQCVDVGKYSFDGKYGKYVKLKADLTYGSSDAYSPVGQSTKFLGSFDGGSKTISGIRYANAGAEKVGLFAQIGDYPCTAVVKDLTLSDCQFNGGSSMLNGFNGGVLAGEVYGGATISNVSVLKSAIVGSTKAKGDTSVGGLVGSLSKESKVSECTVSGTTVTNVVTDDGDNESGRCFTGGIGGYVHGSEVSACTVAGCTISSEHSGTNNSGNEVGGIVGAASYGIQLLNNRVTGLTTVTDRIYTDAKSFIGAVCGNDENIGGEGSPVFKNNYYDKSVTVSHQNSTLTKAATISGYTPRGTRRTSLDFVDVDANDAAMMYVKPAILDLTTTGANAASTLAFSQTTVGDNCYDGSGSTYYYAPTDKIVLNATYYQREDDGRTFYEEVSVSAKDGSTPPADVTVTPTAATLTGNKYTSSYSFTMPETGATVTAKIEESSGFTIPSNGKSWMSLFHEWTDANKAPVNYTVTAVTANIGNSRTRAVTNPLELLTIKEGGIDLDAGTASTLDLEGISYSGVPTLLHQEGGLPEKLRFDPVAGKTAPQYDPQFIGGVSDLSVYAQKSVFMLFNSELVRADLSGDTSGGISADPHRAFVVMSGAPAASRLMLISDDATGIHSIDNGPSTVDDADGKWFDLQGRQLDGKPSKKGLYIRNGKKMIIK